MSDKKGEFVDLEALALSLGVPSTSIRQVFRFGNRRYLTKVEAESVTAFHHKIMADAEAARQRLTARLHVGTVGSFELAIQIAEIYVEEFGRLDVFTPEELELAGLRLGWLIYSEFGNSRVSDEIADLTRTHVRAEARKHVDAILAEEG